MYIKKESVENFLGPIAGGAVNVSFFTCTNNHRLKKIDLFLLSPQQRNECAQSHRLIAVIEIGGILCAHAHAATAKELQNAGDLTLDGKKISVKALTEEESDSLSLLAKKIEEHVANKEETKETETNKEHGGATASSARQEFFGFKTLLSDAVHAGHLFAQMVVKGGISAIISNCLNRFAMARREQQKIQEIDDRKFAVQQEAIKKGIAKEGVRKEAVAANQQKQENIATDLSRLAKTRGSTSFTKPSL